MFKNVVIAFVIGLFQFQQHFVLSGATGYPKKIELVKDGDLTVYYGQLIAKGVAKFDDKNERFGLNTKFRHRFHKDEVDFRDTDYDDISMRNVTSYADGTNDTILFNELTVTMKTIEGVKIHTGSLHAVQGKRNWTLRFSCPQACLTKQVACMRYLKDLQTTFQEGKTFIAQAHDFELLEWDGLRGTVDGRSEIGFTQAYKLVLAVRFAPSKPVKVRKNGDEKDFQAFQLPGLIKDGGRLVFNDINFLRTLRSTGLFQYTSEAEPKEKKPRPIADGPSRELTDSCPNGFLFIKPMVTILYDVEKELLGMLFLPDGNQNKIIVEVQYTTEYTDDFLKKILPGGSPFTIKPSTKGLKNEAIYTVDPSGPTSIPVDGYNTKEGLRFTFVKSGQK